MPLIPYPMEASFELSKAGIQVVKILAFPVVGLVVKMISEVGEQVSGETTCVRAAVQSSLVQFSERVSVCVA